MLIISIIMFVRKKTKIRIAYALLTASSLVAIAHDAQLRNAPPPATPRATETASRAPLEITPLAESPFPEARPNYLQGGGTGLTKNETAPGLRRKRAASQASDYFLTVSIQVDCGDGPIAFDRGTRVHLVRQQDGKLLVRTNGNDFLVEKSQLTDDINALPALARNSS